MPGLKYFELANSFYKFEKIAEKYGFYLEEVHKMDESIRAMNPAESIDPKEFTEENMHDPEEYEGGLAS